MGTAVEVPISSVRARAFTVPIEEPESDGTLEWDATTVVVVEAAAGGWASSYERPTWPVVLSDDPPPAPVADPRRY